MLYKLTWIKIWLLAELDAKAKALSIENKNVWGKSTQRLDELESLVAAKEKQPKAERNFG
jgi:hypothetical protein